MSTEKTEYGTHEDEYDRRAEHDDSGATETPGVPYEPEESELPEDGVADLPHHAADRTESADTDTAENAENADTTDTTDLSRDTAATTESGDASHATETAYEDTAYEDTSFTDTPYAADPEFASATTTDDTTTGGTTTGGTTTTASLPSAAAPTTNSTSPEPLLASTSAEDFLGRWSDVQTTFIEDPHRSVSEADTLLTEVLTAYQQAVEQRRAQISATVTDDTADTEKMRLALLEYRTIITTMLSAHGAG